VRLSYPYIERKGFEKFLHGKGKAVRNGMLGSVEKVISKQLMFDELNLHPHNSLETITRSTVSLATDGFYKAVKAGQLNVETRYRDHKTRMQGKLISPMEK